MSAPTIKQRIGRAIPYPLIAAGRKIVHLGPLACQVCRARVRRFGDSGYGFEVLERLQVVGGMRRGADRCPVCHSTSRERLVWFWLNRSGRGWRFPAGTRIAHFAPEKGLSERLQGIAGGDYNAYDFDPSRYRHLAHVNQADLGALPIADARFDLLICNHVLEHVPNLARALAEIRRVLAPGGAAILQVPVALKLDRTIELGAESSPEGRERAVGQDDHLRLFSRGDYPRVLDSAGFEVTEYDPFRDDAPSATDWRLDPFETLFLCSKLATD